MSKLQREPGKAGWTTLSETVLLERPPFFRVIQECVKTERGTIVEDYFRVVLPRFSVCVPVTADNRVVTLWQYKHGPKLYSLTFPAGFVEANETPEKSCRRELLEETGYAADALISLGTFIDAGNQEGATGHYFVATNCIARQEPDPGDLETMSLRLMTWEEIDAAVTAGHITITHHVTAWLLACRKLQASFRDGDVPAATS